MMSDEVLAAIIVPIITFAVWMCIVIHEKLEHPKPKPPPKAIYNTANNEPIGFDFNHKDWDAPQWEAPEWTFDRPYIRSFKPLPTLIPNQILSTNEIRTANMLHYMEEISHGGMMILPEGVNIQYLNTEAQKNDHLSNIRTRPQHTDCPICTIRFRKRYKDEIVIRNTAGEPVRIYDKQEYSQYKRDQVIHLPPPQLKWIKH